MGNPDEDFDPERLRRIARQTMSSAERRRKYSAIDFLGESYWYGTQRAFLDNGSTGPHQRFIYGGNQTGKTLVAGFEVALHLTGNYPHWWTGLRFNKPVRVWVVGESSTLVRDTLQRKLCGQTELGTGLVPLESISRRPIMVPGGQHAIDTLFVAHTTDGAPDGISTAIFKSFEMRRE